MKKKKAYTEFAESPEFTEKRKGQRDFSLRGLRSK
jgi:hypothetical protein